MSVNNQTNAFAVFGPYWSSPFQGDVTVWWTLAVDNNSADDMHILDLDVSYGDGSNVITTMAITRTQFNAPGQPQNFSLSVTVPPGSPPLEFRVYYYCCVFVEVSMIGVSSSPLSSGTFEQFWTNDAHFDFVAAHTFPSPNGESGTNVGFDFVTMPDGTWYLFHREYEFEPQPSYCAADYARILVRTSTDQGLTWSDGTVLVTPTPNTPWECCIVDGGAFFDAETTTWHYLGQCMAKNEVWNMCHWTSAGANPMSGGWVPNGNNPVVQSGQLWSSICSGSGKHCTPGMGSEGTPEIVMKDESGYFFVTFHGWDAAAVQSARGVAKTRDFNTWVTSDGLVSLPGDAIFTSADCMKWPDVPGGWAKGGCVGGGEGTILVDGGYLNMIIEAPDISLGCLGQNQNWVLGLLRAPSFQWASTQWHQMAIEPVVIPVVKQGCYIQYHRLFSDAATGTVYLEFWADGWMQLFKLVPGSGTLPIVAGPPPTSLASLSR